MKYFYVVYNYMDTVLPSSYGAVVAQVSSEEFYIREARIGLSASLSSRLGVELKPNQLVIHSWKEVSKAQFEEFDREDVKDEKAHS